MSGILMLGEILNYEAVLVDKTHVIYMGFKLSEDVPVSALAEFVGKRVRIKIEEVGEE